MPDTFTGWTMLYLVVAMMLSVVGFCHLQWQLKITPKHFNSQQEIAEAMRVRLLLATTWPLVTFVIVATLALAAMFYLSKAYDGVTASQAVSNNFPSDNPGKTLLRESDELLSEDDLLPVDRVALYELRRDIARYETTNELDS